eukprot:scaffold58720_cov39-Cyclotella_meneghiniana.AAC.2
MMLNKTSIISFFLFASLALANGDNVKEKGATGKPDLLRESRFLMPSNNPGAAKKGNTAAKAAKGAKVDDEDACPWKTKRISKNAEDAHKANGSYVDGDCNKKCSEFGLTYNEETCMCEGDEDESLSMLMVIATKSALNLA